MSNTPYQYATNISQSGEADSLKVHEMHERFAYRDRKMRLVIQREETAGGYWRGSRIYTGRDKDGSVMFIASVPDCGGGSNTFHQWLTANNAEASSYVQVAPLYP